MAFLSPMVLRKELETLLVVSGEKILREQDFIEHHKMLFWNLYYGKILQFRDSLKLIFSL